MTDPKLPSRVYTEPERSTRHSCASVSARGVSRRKFLRLGGATGLSLGLAGAGISGTRLVADSAAANPGNALSGKGARNIVFMVSDGMSNGALSMAHHFARVQYHKKTEWMALYDRPGLRRGLMETCSHNSLVTDSAAASSAWGIGQRVDNRSINYTPDGKMPEPILLTAQRLGKSTGLVSTARITHATPAGFAANVPHRDQEDDIARQYLERNIDVLLGGGFRHFAPHSRRDGEDLHAAFAKAGYQVVGKKGELTSAAKAAAAGAASITGKHGRLLGTFSPGHMPYTLDRLHSAEIAETTPSLAEMTGAALQILQRNTDGFVLQVEGGRIDHAGHANDGATSIREQLDFDAAIAVANAFAAAHPDTLVVITTDHGTGGPNLNGVGPDYAHTDKAFARLANFQHSREFWAPQLLVTSIDKAHSLLERNTGISLKPEHMDSFIAAVEAYKANPRADKPFGRAVGEILLDYTGIGWTSSNHTGELVELAAYGPGSEGIPPFIRNFELHTVLLEAMRAPASVMG